MSSAPSQPLVSVIMPFRQDVATIADAVRSVISQTWPSIELVLCDDGSTDGSLAVARDAIPADALLSVQIVATGGRGAAAARNAGMSTAHGEFLAFLDADDLWMPEKVNTCVQRMLADRLDLLGHSEEWRPLGGEGRVVHYSALVDRRVPLAVSVFRQNPFSTSATVMRADLVARAGLFDETLPSAEDYDYWLRLAVLPGVRAGFIDTVLGVYTLRAGSESSRVDARHEAMLAIGDRFIDRIRALSPSPRTELWRYRSRVRIASGVRYVKAGRALLGAGLMAAGLLQWPFRPELARWARARVGRQEVAA